MVRYIQNFSGMVVVIDALKRKKSVNHSMSSIALFISRLTLNSPSRKAKQPPRFYPFSTTFGLFVRLWIHPCDQVSTLITHAKS